MTTTVEFRSVSDVGLVVQDMIEWYQSKGFATRQYIQVNPFCAHLYSKQCFLKNPCVGKERQVMLSSIDTDRIRINKKLFDVYQATHKKE